MYRWIVFIHVFSALVFFMAHGVAVAVTFQVKRERNPERLRAILDLSRSMTRLMWLSLTALILAGIVAGIMGNWWSQGWISTALILLILLTGWLGYYVMCYFVPLREALGMPNPRAHDVEAPPPASDEEIQARINAIQPWALMGPALIVTLVIVWLMIFKPF